jgi:PAS domain S-box-containing protein
MAGTGGEMDSSLRESRRQASILRAVLSSVDSAVAFKGLDGRYLGCNAEYERAFGMSEAELTGKDDEELFGPEDAARIRAEDRELIESGRPMNNGLVWRKGLLGLERLYERRKVPLAAEDGVVFGIAAFWHYVGDSILAEKANSIHLALSRDEGKLSSRAILTRLVDELEAATESSLGFFVCLEAGGESIGRQAWSTDAKGGGCGLSPREGHAPLAEAGGWADCVRQRSPIVLEGPSSFAGLSFPPGHAPLRRALFLPLLRDGAAIGVLGLANKARAYNDWDLELCSRVAASVWEIYERKIAQERNRDLSIQRDIAISAMKAGVETWYIDEGRREYDASWAGILGYAAGELPGDSMAVMEMLCHPDDFERASERMRAYLAGAAPFYEAEFRMRHKDGHWVWVLERAQVVERDAEGEPKRLSGLIVDISGLKEVEERLRHTLGEKDILLQELFHRTKNTMQLINAMLELKKQGGDSAPFDEAIEGVQSKIIAMSLVQEKLYRSGDLSVLDLGDYVAELVELIKDGSPFAPGNVSIASDTKSVPVSVDAAIPCGLIISELVSNSLMHAFPNDAEGRIDVSVDRVDDSISIAVSDDGVGVPSGFNPRSGPRLGLRTVIGIGEEQLRGRVEFGAASKGFSCKLTFKDVYYPSRLFAAGKPTPRYYGKDGR